MSYFKHHVFFCCNQRQSGESCCNDHGASALQTYAKERTAALGLKGKGSVRINKAGCLGRCDEGPVLVVYPDNVWYTYVDKDDVDDIIDTHLVQGRIVDRLRLPEDAV
ncbi:MAG: NAD(P)H-dependent oxidoreductase subunit E [Proteobacteria bacterium]|nr:NAD(P)H-dependent oxidoreductase subunit E [Pseudomonadota bacterium]